MRLSKAVPCTVCVFALTLAFGAAGCESELTDTARVTVGSRALVVEVADSAAEQARGLSGRRRLNDSEGMLFVWEDEGPRAFTISSVQYDLDVIFIGKDKVVNEILPLSPGEFERAQGSYASRYAIEVRGGWAERYGIEPGDEFSIEGGS